MPADFSNLEGVVVIIPAAGVGSRMNADVPKQYLKINRQTILDITLNKFLAYEKVKLVVLVISPEDRYYLHLENVEHENVVIIDGGEQRAQSVYNAIRYLYDSGLPDDSPLMVHDAARPCITDEDLDRLYESFSTSGKACLLAAPVVDTLQKISSDNKVEGLVERQQIVRAFTPQMARFEDLAFSLKAALDNSDFVTDEVSALTQAGHEVNVVFGRSDNIKVTVAEDLALAEFYLSQQEKDNKKADIN